MKRYTRRKSYKVKILFSLLFLIILCMMAGKVLNSDFTLLPLDNITHHVASEDNGWNLILVNRNSYIPDDYKDPDVRKIVAKASKYTYLNSDGTFYPIKKYKDIYNKLKKKKR